MTYSNLVPAPAAGAALPRPALDWPSPARATARGPMGGGLFAYATSAGWGCASWTAAQQTLLGRRRGSVAAVVASAAGWDEEAAAAERTVVSLSLSQGGPGRLRQGPEEVALGGNRSWEQPGLRGSEPTVSVLSARCEETEGRGMAARPPLDVHAVHRCPRGTPGRRRGRGKRLVEGEEWGVRARSWKPPLWSRGAREEGCTAASSAGAGVGSSRSTRPRGIRGRNPRAAVPPESQAGACCGRGAETACAGRWDWRGDLSGLPSSVRFSLARVSHAVHIAAAPGVKV